MVDRIQKLREHIDYLSEELVRLKKERDKLDREIDLLESTLKNGQALYNSRSGAYVQLDYKVGKYNGKSQVAAARRFLAEHDNRPYHAREIYVELSANGVNFKGREPIWSLATNLALHKDFEPIGTKKATFRLKDTAYQSELEAIKKEHMEEKFPGFNHMMKGAMSNNKCKSSAKMGHS